ENLFLRRLVEGGLVGVATLFAFLALLARESFTAAPNSSDRIWRVALRALVAAPVIQSLTSDTLFFDQDAAVFAVYSGLIGAGLGRTAIDSAEVAREASPRRKAPVA